MMSDTQGVAADPFDAVYNEGISRSLGPPRRPTTRSMPTAHGPQSGDEETGGDDRDEPASEAGAAALPPMPVALGGIVLTPWRKLERGWVLVEGSRIIEVTETEPRDVATIDTGGVIMPGMIDLHGHPEYNIFGPWEPPRLYPNRFGWRDSDEYEAVVRKPWRALTGDGELESLKATMARYAETRAMVGGVTAIQGASEHYPKQFEALVRNVDLWIFGEHRARSTIDVGGRFDEEDAQRIIHGVADGSVTAHYVHLAEGVRGNVACMTEWRTFNEFDLLTPATIVIHGSALAREQLADIRDGGGKLVWSPQSNLRLYGETTDIAAVGDLRLPLGLGADWLPSGSTSLLAEMKVARRVAHTQGAHLTARDLVLMVTRDNARIAGLGDHLGVLAPGRPADLVVLQRRHDDGWESVLATDPSHVDLVMIVGDLVYGRPDWLGRLTDPGEYESVIAWGRPMLLDTRYGSPATSDEGDDGDTGPGRRLAEMRDRLTNRYPAIGPIFA